MGKLFCWVVRHQGIIVVAFIVMIGAVVLAWNFSRLRNIIKRIFKKK